jgi:RloB-like protein
MPRGGRQASSYARRPPQREPYDTVLIVCEGQKSEPTYFNALCFAYQLSSANVHVMPARGSDPISIVRFAEERMDDYDRVFCVFDRDGHANYDQALQRIARAAAGRAGKFKAVTSWPCFELWLLLHHRYSAAPFNAVGGESSCDRVLRELRQHIPNNGKGSRSVFADTAASLETAIRNAKQLARHNADTGSRNPATRVHELVEYLLALRPKT